ncbi:MAG: threonine ammonia-lyase [Bdellovibrionaceae bacterium]|nr:threonine ammonia-lyase [Pseudobdellovibrionaceae bacterium]MBX3033096.1 threonine ammonia-lyase [Pseudobdellovibrionaceae bacterium]
MKVTLQDIQNARTRLSGVVHHTETSHSNSLSQWVGSQVHLKSENLQRTGSFKIRGAYNKIVSLTDEEKKRGVVASSAGNHAQGVALSARLQGVKATIVMPEGASLNKISATRGYGAEVVLHGEIYDDAYAKAREIESRTGAVFVHPYEDAMVIAGQGTVGLEMLEAVPDLDTVLVAVGGGGLIAGVATAIKALRPQCRVIGVQSQAADAMTRLFRGQSAAAPGARIATIADGIAVKTPSAAMHADFLSKHVDEMVTVNDDQIAAAIVYLLERTKNLVEGAGAAAVAALMSGQVKVGPKVGVVLSGGNIDLNIIAKIVSRGLIQQGRLAEISVIVDDQPGTMHRLTKIFADQRANILEVHHDRVERGLSLREAKVDFVVEMVSHEHAEQLKQALQKAGARLL